MADLSLLTQTIFADDEYSKPFFVTYVNTAFFIIPLFPAIYNQLRNDKSELNYWRGVLDRVRQEGLSGWISSHSTTISRSHGNGVKTTMNTDTEGLLNPENAEDGTGRTSTVRGERSISPNEPLVVQHSDTSEGFRSAQGQKGNDLGLEDDAEGNGFSIGETAKSSLYFCVLWVSPLSLSLFVS